MLAVHGGDGDPVEAGLHRRGREEAVDGELDCGVGGDVGFEGVGEGDLPGGGAARTSQGKVDRRHSRAAESALNRQGVVAVELAGPAESGGELHDDETCLGDGVSGGDSDQHAGSGVDLGGREGDGSRQEISRSQGHLRTVAGGGVVGADGGSEMGSCNGRGGVAHVADLDGDLRDVSGDGEGVGEGDCAGGGVDGGGEGGDQVVVDEKEGDCFTAGEGELGGEGEGDGGRRGHCLSVVRRSGHVGVDLPEEGGLVGGEGADSGG